MSTSVLLSNIHGVMSVANGAVHDVYMGHERCEVRCSIVAHRVDGPVSECKSHQ